jgi:hypothetical protein
MTCCVTSHITRHYLWRIEYFDDEIELGGEKILYYSRIIMRICDGVGEPSEIVVFGIGKWKGNLYEQEQK